MRAVSGRKAFAFGITVNDMAMQHSHCANCEKKTATFWRNQEAFFSICGSSHSEMANRGMNTAGHWDNCPQCQTRCYYEHKKSRLLCEKCGLTTGEAQEKDELRPKLVSYRPTRVTSGSLLEIQYRSERSSLPVLLSISWLPQHGHTSVRLVAEDFPENATMFSLAIDVPIGATSAIVIDRSGRSRKCEIPIDFIATPHLHSKRSLLRRLLGFN